MKIKELSIIFPIYNEEDMVAPGCRYSAIREVNGVTTPVTD